MEKRFVPLFRESISKRRAAVGVGVVRLVGKQSNSVQRVTDVGGGEAPLFDQSSALRNIFRVSFYNEYTEYKEWYRKQTTLNLMS